jgi:glycosyl hydrolase family 53
VVSAHAARFGVRIVATAVVENTWSSSDGALRVESVRGDLVSRCLCASRTPDRVVRVAYYPFWHGTITQLRTNIDDLATRYDREVMIQREDRAHSGLHPLRGW